MLYTFITLITFLAMEGVTWLTHKYIMHGFLWKLHEDHHQKKPHSFFEKNDYFFLIFAIPSMVLFALGAYVKGLHILFFIGLGISMYGFAYFMIHEIVIHQRFKFFSRTNNFYLRALRKAHKIHHKHLEKHDGECFGMLWVPIKYFKEALRHK